MNTVRSFWYAASTMAFGRPGAGAYFLAKREINADRQSKLDQARKKQAETQALQSTEHARTDSAGSPSQEASSDPAPTRHAPATEAERIAEKSKYESSVPYRRPKGDRFSYFGHPHRPPRLSCDAIATMVTTPELSIAKASLTASLLRADPESLNRAAVNDFLELLNTTLDQCSRPNVKKSKDWVLANVVPSKGRASTLGKYLVALAESMEKDFDRPSVRRRRLHVLFIANDVLHHTVVGRGDQHLVQAWEAHLPAMIATASTFEKCPKHLAKVRALIDLWETKGYVSADLVNRLRETFTRHSDKESGTRIHMTPAAFELAKEAPYIMPAVHGDPSLPWHEQPASLWLAQLRPGMTKPMRRSLVRPVQLNPGPASEVLIKAVKDILEDADTLYRKESLRDRANADFNPLGERLDQRPQTYWGWSPQFCRRVKEGRHYVPKDRPRSRSRSRRRSSSCPSRPSRSPKRSRFASSRSPRSRDASRSPARHHSRSRSGSRRRRGQHASSGFHRRSPNSRHGHKDGPYSRSRSLSPPRRRRDGSYSRSRSPGPRRGRTDLRRSYSGSESRDSSGSQVSRLESSRSASPSDKAPDPDSISYERTAQQMQKQKEKEQRLKRRLKQKKRQKKQQSRTMGGAFIPPRRPFLPPPIDYPGYDYGYGYSQR
ncbi:hypothetical protein L249_7646 [Ophiocordyceps polyrhachis-furcata BCC 54312]|uniref:CID domain-containing protein n=1 Tax=Ophiocordyceps polyrhachis-furcata BCC 54312 TaxID=1330021 RepID=A0A367L9W7_9HYPO|nr:hypothetical protein L249_7646 [Ophiocordyceps polyrhachis-furcata BCC 54312]